MLYRLRQHIKKENADDIYIYACGGRFYPNICISVWRKLVFIKYLKSHLSACVDWAAIRARPPDGSQVMHQTNAGITLQVMGATIYLIKTKCFPWSATAYALISLSAQTTKSVSSSRRHTGAIDHSRPNVIPPFSVSSFSSRRMLN